MSKGHFLRKAWQDCDSRCPQQEFISIAMPSKQITINGTSPPKGDALVALIELQHLSKTFRGKTQTVEALKDINLEINQGDIYGIIGMSGAGKSTLVRCINFLEKPKPSQLSKRLSAVLEARKMKLRQKHMQILVKMF